MILILGLGWTGDYIRSHSKEQGIVVYATTTTGRDDTIPFTFNDHLSADAYSQLPKADMIVVTFPLPSLESPQLLMEGYERVHGIKPNWVLFGSTRCWKGHPWADRHGPVVPDIRYQIEQVFITRGGCVFNLAGLYGGTRHPKNWIHKVVPTKEALAQKTSIHLIHGLDIARLVLAAEQKFTRGQRWLVTDLRVYDWWELVMRFDDGERIPWVLELLTDSNARALPRSPDLMDRCLDSKETWIYFGLLPTQSI